MLARTYCCVTAYSKLYAGVWDTWGYTVQCGLFKNTLTYLTQGSHGIEALGRMIHTVLPSFARSWHM